jgi:hypothetical protein
VGRNRDFRAGLINAFNALTAIRPGKARQLGSFGDRPKGKKRIFVMAITARKLPHR